MVLSFVSQAATNAIIPLPDVDGSEKVRGKPQSHPGALTAIRRDVKIQA